MRWYLAVNTAHSSSEVLGRVISSHRSARAAFAAIRAAQPDQRFSPGLYVPGVVRLSARRLDRGAFVPRHADWHTYLEVEP